MSERDTITTEGELLPPHPYEMQFLAAAPPGTGEAVPIADGMLWLRIPLPMELNHINVWLLEDGDGWLLVDTGMGEDVCREAWLALEDRVLAGRRLTRILVTHDHPDHMGLSAWLGERHGAGLWMSEVAHRSASESARVDPEAWAARWEAFLHSHGLDVHLGPGSGGVTRKWFRGVAPLAASPSESDVIEAGRGRWRVIETGGHCRGHLCLHDAARGLLVSGDQVLPSISPNVSVGSLAPEADPLGDFLASLERLGQCEASTLVLPSHGRPFRGLHRRLADLRGHHEEQLAALRGFCAEPRTALEVLPTLFRRTTRGFHRLLAMGEAIAHLNHLCARGELERRRDDSGIIRFVTRAQP